MNHAFQDRIGSQSFAQPPAAHRRRWPPRPQRVDLVAGGPLLGQAHPLGPRKDEQVVRTTAATTVKAAACAVVTGPFEGDDENDQRS